MAFQVDDIQKACRELEEKGGEIFEGPKVTPWGQKVAYFKDPDGYVWEVLWWRRKNESISWLEKIN